MIDVKSRWHSATDTEKWAARGATFVAKAKATKVVWFPPEPVKTGKKAASTATKATKKATRGATGKASGTAGKASRTAGKASASTRKVANPARRKRV